MDKFFPSNYHTKCRTNFFLLTTTDTKCSVVNMTGFHCFDSRQISYIKKMLLLKTRQFTELNWHTPVSDYCATYLVVVMAY